MNFYKTTEIQTDQDINIQIAAKLNQVILDNISNEANKIYEYDIGIIEDDSTILQIAEDHYLLLNKKHVKSFYFFWRQNLLSENSLCDQNLASLSVLLINPNVATAWSKRKSLYETNQTHLSKEFEFNKLVLIKHSKCECAYVHRRWLVKKLANLDEFLLREIEFFFTSLCFKIKANYYCWSYLNWILFYALENSLVNQPKMIQIFSWFFNKLEGYLYLNPSDYCLFHTRLNLIIRLNDQNKLVYLNEFKTFIEHEFDLIDDFTVRYSHLSTIWNYRKYLVLYLVNIKHFKSNCTDINWNELNRKLNEKIEELKIGEKIDLDFSETACEKLLLKRELDILNYFKVNIKSENCENSIKFLNKFLLLYFNIYKKKFVV